MATDPGRGLPRRPVVLPLLLALALGAAPTARAALADAFAGSPPVVLSQPLPLLFQATVFPLSIPDVVQRVQLELWSTTRGASGANVTLFDDATRDTSTGGVTTFLVVSAAWLAAAVPGERAYVRAAAYDAGDAAYMAPGSPAQVVESSRLLIVAAPAAGVPAAYREMVGSCYVSVCARVAAA